MKDLGFARVYSWHRLIKVQGLQGFSGYGKSVDRFKVQYLGFRVGKEEFGVQGPKRRTLCDSVAAWALGVLGGSWGFSK